MRKIIFTVIFFFLFFAAIGSQLGSHKHDIWGILAIAFFFVGIYIFTDKK